MSRFTAAQSSIYNSPPQLGIPTHILPTPVSRPNTRVERLTPANTRSLTATAARIATDDHRSAGVAAGLLVDGDPERGEGSCGAAVACQCVKRIYGMMLDGKWKNRKRR